VSGLATPGEMPEVDAAAAVELVAEGMLMVDVREQDEWDAGHSPDAILVPLSELAERVAELPTGTRFLVVCHSGMRSLRATSMLRNGGRDAVNVVGGMIAWSGTGGAIVSSSST